MKKLPFFVIYCLFQSLFLPMGLYAQDLDAKKSETLMKQLALNAKEKGAIEAVSLLEIEIKAHPDDKMRKRMYLVSLLMFGDAMVKQDAQLAAEKFLGAAAYYDLVANSGDPLCQKFHLFQARGYALKGQAKMAAQSLKNAVDEGLENLGEIATDPSFASLDKNELSELLAELEKKVIDRLRKEVRKQIAEFKSTPFNFTVKSIDGEPVSSEQLRGKLVIVDLWGTWCGPCVMEIPHLISLKEKYKGKVEVVGFAYEKKSGQKALDKLKVFVSKKGINYPVCLGTDEIRAQVKEFLGYPTKLFIDGDGMVRLQTVGSLSDTKLEAITLEIMSLRQIKAE